MVSAVCIFSPHGMTLVMAFASPRNQRELSVGSICFMYWPLVFRYLQLSFHR